MSRGATGIGVRAVALVAAMAAGCAGDAPTGPDAAAPPLGPVVTTPFDVYRAVLGQRAGQNGQPVVLLDETRTMFFCTPRVGGPVGEEWRGAIDHYQSENATPRALGAGDHFRAPYVVMSPAQHRDIFGTPNILAAWRTFHDTYPGASLVTLSAVGFDAQQTRAVVQVGSQCGSLCGEWRDYYLERAAGQWTVAPLRTCFAVS